MNRSKLIRAQTEFSVHWTESIQSRLALVLAVVIAYVAGFLLFYDQMGGGVGALVAIPVITAAWLFGLRTGLLAGLLGFLANTLLLNLAGFPGGGWDVVIQGGGGPGHLTLILIGVAVGQLGDLREQLKRELAERKQAEFSLQTAKEYAENLIQTANAIVVGLDVHGNVTVFNEAAEKITGYTRAELENRNWFQVLVPRDRYPQVWAEFQQLMSKGIPKNFENPILTKTGEERFIVWQNNELREQGKIVGTISFGIDITDHKLAEAGLNRRAHEISALYETTRDLATQLDLPTLLQSIVERATTLLGAPGGGVYLYDAARDDLQIAVAKGSEVTVGTRLQIGEGMAGRVAQTRQPLIVEDYHSWEGRSFKYENVPFASVVEVPMLYGGELIGVLTVHEIGASTRRFNDEDARLLSLFASQAAGAVHNARLFQETGQRAERLSILNHIARAVSATLNVDEILQVVYQEITRALESDAFFIALYDQAAKELDFRIRVDKGVREPQQRRPLGGGLTSWVIVNKQPILIRDYEREKELYPSPRLFGSMQPPVSWLGVPMLVGSELVGAISVQTYRANSYGAAEQELLSTIADTVAVAIENARLFEETKQRLSELEALNRISSSLRAAQTLEEMLPALLDETLKALGTEAGIIRIYDETRDALLTAASRGWLTQLAPQKLRRDEGIAGHVFATGNAYAFREFMTDPYTRETARPHVPPGWGGACVPIRAANEIIGVLFASVQLPREFTTGEVHLLTTVAEIAGNAIHRTRLSEQTERHLQRMQALHQIDRAISSSLDLRVAFEIFLDQAMTQLHVDAADVLVFNPRTQTLEYGAGRGFRTAALQHTHLRLGDGLAGRAALERQIVVINNLTQDADGLLRSPFIVDEEFMVYYGVPLIAKGRVNGVLEIFHRAALEQDKDWLDFLETLAGQAAIGIDNAELYGNLQRTNIELALAYDTTLEGWSRALDLRDKETEGHTERVTELALRVARVIGIGGEDLVHIRRGALLHDIGKMGISDHILHKPAPLEDEEWESMRQHPVFAFELLSPIEYLRPALDIPYCHHEKWDGTGYPRGLKGNEIPLAARIFAVVDVWDALRSNRPYRAAWTEKKVRHSTFRIRRANILTLK